jgi:hypothetical protein
VQLCAQEAVPNKWSNPQGAELEADFVRLEEDAVILRSKDGRELTVPLTSLSIDSHLQAVKLAHPEGFDKPVPKAEVEAERPVSEVPDLQLDVDQMLKSPFPNNPTVEQYLQVIESEAQAGNLFVQWHLLPTKMQADTEQLIVQAANVLGPATFSQLNMLFKEINTLLIEKEEFIFGHPAIASQPQAVAVLKSHWPVLVHLSQALSKPEHWQPDSFKQGNVARWMATLVADTAPAYFAVLDRLRSELPGGELIPNLRDVKYEIVSQSADTAQIRQTFVGQEPTTITLKKVGNQWLNTNALTASREMLDKAKGELAKDKSSEIAMMRTTLAGIIAAVGGLARATTQEEFNASVDNLQIMAQGVANSLGPLQGGGNAAGGTPRGGGRGPRGGS